jgi:hypothetical protein
MEIKSKRGAKTKSLISQKDTILNVLLNGGCFTERELGKLLWGEDKIGARALIAVLRDEGNNIATKPRYNEETNRRNSGYYIERDNLKYMLYCRNNGFFEFKKGPKY